MKKHKLIKSYNSFIINEMTEFNLQRLNPDSIQPAMHVDNPQLSVNAFDKHQDLVRQAISKLGQFHGALMGTNAYRILKSKLSLDDQQVTSLKIIRIIKNENLNYDVYLSFVIDEEEYWGVVKDILGRAELKSEVFKDFDLIQTKEWVIKLKGLIVKSIKEFLKPQYGHFKLLADEIICYSNLNGKMLKMKSGTRIEVLRAYDDKIIFEHDGDKYTLIGDNFIYFNWWFEKISD